MLQFILGRAGSGKTTEMYRKIKAENKSENHILFLVPEQYSFESEKRMLQELGAEASQQITVMSFTRLSDFVFRKHGKIGLPKLDDGGRNIFMSMALKEVSNELDFYVGHTEELITMMLGMSTELKMCGILPEVLLQTAKQITDENLKKKLAEIGLVLSAYDAIVAQSFVDPLDDLTRLKTTFYETDFFKNYKIYVDSFKGFTPQEMAILEIMMVQSKQTTISLCLNQLHNHIENDLFAKVRHTANQLMNAARSNGVSVAVPVMLTQSIRFENNGLTELEAQFNHITKNPVSEVPTGISLFCGATIYEEATYVAATIRQLVIKKGYRYNDFAIIARSLESYRGVLDIALSNYEIPCFMDTPRSITAEPLMCLVVSALKIIQTNFSTNEVFLYLKTGLVGIESYEISLLENYTFLWDLSGNDWLVPFTAHPQGFSENQGELVAKQLEKLNDIRMKIVEPLLQFKKATLQATGLDYAKAIYMLLETLHVQSALLTLANTLRKFEQIEVADEQARLWDILMGILDQFALTLREEVNYKDFVELLRMVILSYEVASIPQSLDHISVGVSDRMRPAEPKVVFVIGAVQGEFPLVPTSTGALSDEERQTLIAAGLPISATLDDVAIEEQFLVYTSLTSASQKLYVTFHRGNATGLIKMQSSIVTEIEKIFPNIAVQTEQFIAPEQLASAPIPAFGLLAKNYKSNTVFQSTLLDLFSNRIAFAPQLVALKRASSKEPEVFKNAVNAQLLFHKEMKISASQVESYHLCRFQYFCRYGLGLRELKKAEMNPMEFGNLTHYLLEQVFKNYEAEALLNMTNDEIEDLINRLILDYIEMQMGGVENKTPRFQFLFRRIAQSAKIIVNHIAKELAQSAFKPLYCEAKIAEDGEFPPLEIQTANGNKVIVEGKVDRADVLGADSTSYIRIIDYKTGVKEFKLGDILNGMNMQMLIYLAAIIAHGKYRPAGVFYMPAARPSVNSNRGELASEFEKAQNKALQMQGVMLEDANVIAGSEKEPGAYFYAPRNKYNPENQLAPNEFNEVLEHVKQKVSDMADELRDGKVEAFPLSGTYKGCEYCPYFAICKHEGDAETKDFVSCKKAELLAEIAKKGEKSDE